jgi:hypothetical protein
MVKHLKIAELASANAVSGLLHLVNRRSVITAAAMVTF